MADLLEDLRTHLIAAGIVRDPRVAGAAPPMWLDRRNGLPAPGEPKDATGDRATEVGPNAVVGADFQSGIPATAFESFFRKRGVRITFRTLNGGLANDIERQVRAAIADRRNFQMGARTVIDCEEWAPFRELARDDQATTYAADYIFEVYAYDA